MAGSERPLEHGWLPDTPVGDTVLRSLAHNQGEVNAAVATAAGGRMQRTDAVLLADSGTPVPYDNQAVLVRPLAGPDDGVLDDVEAFFAGAANPATLLSIWPTPDLAARGWILVGPPAWVLRSPGPVPDAEPPPGWRSRCSRPRRDWPRPSASPSRATRSRRRRGGRWGPCCRPPSWAPASRCGSAGSTASLGHVGCGVQNLCLGATLPAARRKGVWESLVWARVADAPELPAAAYTSDFSRPGFVRMGFVPVLRFTLWLRPPSG